MAQEITCFTQTSQKNVEYVLEAGRKQFLQQLLKKLFSSSLQNIFNILKYIPMYDKICT